MLWFVPILIGAALTGGVEGLFYFLNKDVADSMDGAMDAFLNSFQYGIDFWAFLAVCWPLILAFALLLYAGYLIATPREMRTV
jgi:hypothetical protein